MSSTATRCVILNCGKPRSSRGLCLVCYRAASLQIKADKTTWEELEKHGLAMPKTRDNSPFVMAFRNLSSEGK